MTNTGGPAPTGSSVSNAKKGPPAWMLPAVSGLVAALVIAIAVVLLTGDEADAPVASEPATSSANEPDVTEPLVTEPVVTEPVLTNTVTAPDTTVDPAPAPDITLAAAESSVQPASPGFVRITDDEFPIERICFSSPFPGFGLVTYVFDDNGFAEVVEFGNDEGNEFGLVFGNGYSVIDFGDDGFGLEAQQGDAVVEVSVNQGGLSAGSCPGLSTVSNSSSPDLPDVVHAVVDVCFGDVPRFDENNEFSVGFGYSGVIAEGGQFVARPGAGDAFAVDYTGPAGAFIGSTQSATRVDGGAGLQIRAELIGNPNDAFAGEERTVVLDIDESFVDTCPTI